ncbi:unnamed protein product [Closterium sp. Naga37s-1]|nr:unnamed protein product [Closterium sp. Naga37s-1]
MPYARGGVPPPPFPPVGLYALSFSRHHSVASPAAPLSPPAAPASSAGRSTTTDTDGCGSEAGVGGKKEEIAEEKRAEHDGGERAAEGGDDERGSGVGGGFGGRGELVECVARGGGVSLG